MIIEGSDYRISNDGTTVHWDLEVMRTVKPRGKPEREELGDPMYGIPLEKAIKIIINNRLSRKKDTYKLEEYLSEYKKEIVKLKEILNNYGI